MNKHFLAFFQNRICVNEGIVANEILMYFRSLKKTAGDLLLSDSIDTDMDGNSLSLMEVISVEDDMLDNLSARETCTQLSRYMAATLTDREAEIVTMRYGLDNSDPKTQREIAAILGISRSYVSRRR